MSLEGFLYLHRKLAEWEWYDDANTMRLFIHCLIFANYKEKQWRGVNIKRGQFITSQPKLAQELKLSVQQIRTAINKLKSTGEITVYHTPDYSVISVNNYDAYQQNNSLNNSLLTDKQQSNNSLATTTNNNNKDNKEKKLNIYIEKENKNISFKPDPFVNPQVDKTFRMYSEYCTNLLSLSGYKSKKLRESLSDFLVDVNYDFEYIKSVFIKANELKTIIDQPIDLQKIINCHERIANDYYKKLKQSERQETKPKQEEIDYSDFSTYRPY